MPTRVRRRTEQRSAHPCRPVTQALKPLSLFPDALPAIARKLDRMPATLPRRCGLLEGAGEARQRIEEPAGRGPRRGAAAAHRGPVAPHSGAARGYAARFEPCVLVPALPCAWFPLSGSLVVGVGPRLCAGIAVTATLCAAAGDEKGPVFLALGPKAAKMRQSAGGLVLALFSLRAIVIISRVVCTGPDFFCLFLPLFLSFDGLGIFSFVERVLSSYCCSFQLIFLSLVVD